jgi:hypothetical protein
MLGSIAGVMVGVVNVTKETHTRLDNTGTAIMTNRAGDQVVATASLSAQQTISSVLPDDAWSQLKLFTVTSPVTSSTISFLVLGWARIAGQGTFGSIVQLVTYAGTISLDGRVMTFSTDAAPVFEEAGFVVSGSRRRLLDSGIDIVGFFNYLANFDLNALEATALGSSALASNVTFPSFPATYDLTTVTYIPCNAITDPMWCYRAGSAFTVTNPDFAGKYFFTETTKIVLDASKNTLATTSFSYTSRVTMALRNATSAKIVRAHMPTGQAGVWANCITERDVGLMPTDPFAMIRLFNVPPVYVDSNSTVMGKAARHFRFTLTMTSAAAADILSGGNTTLVWPIGTTLVVLDYYDSIVTHFPLRLTAASVFDNWAPPVIIDIVSFTPDANPATAWPGPSPKVDGTFDAATCAANVDYISDPVQLYPSIVAANVLEIDSSPAINNTGRRHLLQELCVPAQFDVVGIHVELSTCVPTAHTSVSASAHSGMITGSFSVEYVPPSSVTANGCITFGPGFNTWPANAQQGCVTLFSSQPGGGRKFCKDLAPSVSLCGLAQNSPLAVGAKANANLCLFDVDAVAMYYPRNHNMDLSGKLAVHVGKLKLADIPLFATSVKIK